MLVAISVATSLFVTAMVLHPPKHRNTAKYAPFTLYALLAGALYFVWAIPSTVGTDAFSTYLLLMHFLLFAAVIIPPIPQSEDKIDKHFLDIPFWACYGATALTAACIHYVNTAKLLAAVPSAKRGFLLHIWRHIFTHPAQGSISLDVVWTGIVVVLWWISSGGLVSVIAKTTFASLVGGLIAARYLGVNWGFILSVGPIVLLLLFGVAMGALHRLRAANASKRQAMLDGLGIVEDGVVPGTASSPPTKSGRKVVVGFWHPYW